MIATSERSGVRKLPLIFVLLLCAGAAKISVGGGEIDIRTTGESEKLSADRIEAWVRAAGENIASFYGKFPVERVTIAVRVIDGNEVKHGVEHNGRYITVDVGDSISADDLKNDWMLTHEMVHLAFPDIEETHQWMNEGLAVYVEPLARVRRGILSEEQFWRETIAGMPQGLPKNGDRGLDRTNTWGRTYWGGAMFWLMADVKIREATKNQKSVDDAAKAILNAGGNGSADWNVDQVIAAGDRGTGTTVLRDLYKQWSVTPISPDLNDLWKRLGVSQRGDKIVFDDAAPLAAIRKAMTARSN